MESAYKTSSGISIKEAITLELRTYKKIFLCGWIEVNFPRALQQIIHPYIKRDPVWRLSNKNILKTD